MARECEESAGRALKTAAGLLSNRHTLRPNYQTSMSIQVTPDPTPIAIDNPVDPESKPAGRLPRRRVSLLVKIVAALWLSAVVGAMAIVVHFTTTPGAGGQAPPRWPIRSRIARDVDRPTLLLFAHPHCPCSRTSLGELDVLMARCEGKVRVHVLFIRPRGVAEDWTQTDLWRSALAIPGVEVQEDPLGAEARLFKAETSGQTLLYDRAGNLLFQGGITMARGHSGDNPGRSSLVSLLAGEVSDEVRTAIYGCPLFDRDCQKPDSP
jgi:hypothetical protein